VTSENCQKSKIFFIAWWASAFDLLNFDLVDWIGKLFKTCLIWISKIFWKLFET
jgi:hypothetical protein